MQRTRALGPGAVVVAALTLSCAAKPALAAPHSSVPQIRLSIVDNRQTPVTLAFAVPDSGCAHLDASADGARYQIKACRVERPGAGRTFDFDIQSRERERDVRVAVRVHLAPRGRAILARLKRSDGSSTRISVELD